ncbi:alpha-ketoglutarate-dependent dioxygenase AlkB [Sphingomonas sp.]|uniref:alpha-ketoglutarate-dependent dioxygenase AlkB n=1 Tax=Sphingomonas sp. TaxID=28214 RepID=UPI001B1223B1|nr:alpha-ketoglutarate-dependent dioxygenase AlkB [Sphingomonas sp.]MBO9713867.1 alpha-ketoglutarate-dependent dioxygenase AlkB [Sphingomonas sp.]
MNAFPDAQADLFGPKILSGAILPGLDYREAVVSETEERALLARIDATGLSPFRFQQWTGKRLTRSFGWRYDFTTGHLGEAEPIPDWLEPLRDRAAGFAGLDPTELVQVLLVRYDPGAGIGWHRDRPAFEHVVGVSLGEPATLRFRRRREGGFDRAAVPLAPRSIYRLSGEARHDWEHSIAPIDALRCSITFRSLASAGR